MPSPANTPAVPLLPVAPLDGESGYLRWKESVLLRLHTLGLAHVLFDEDRPDGEKQRVHDDALCRGHILATLSDRLLPDYAPHVTAGAVWHAVERTYNLDMAEGVSAEKARAFQYDDGKPFLEQLALLQAMTTGTPAVPLLPVAPLDGESGYLRWKESVLLRLHTLGLAHMLYEEKERPAAGEKHWARDNALCRGHILETLSDRLLPDYAPHATARAVWRAVERTYDLDTQYSSLSQNKASAFRYDEDEPLLEQLAHLEALATVGCRGRLDETGLMPVFILDGGFPPELRGNVNKHDPPPCMDKIWEIARKHVVKEIVRKQLALDRLLETTDQAQAQPTTVEQRNNSSNGFRRPRNRKRGRRQR